MHNRERIYTETYAYSVARHSCCKPCTRSSHLLCPLEDEEFADAYFLKKSEHERMLPRWLAEGFWFLSTFVRDHTAHPAWEKTIAREPEYFANAYERLDQLASWFFSGHCPWIDEETGWAYKDV